MHLQAKKTDTALEQLRVLAGTLVPTLSAWLASRANCYSSMVMSEVSEKSSVGVAHAGVNTFSLTSQNSESCCVWS